jgi:neutral ceramidase
MKNTLLLTAMTTSHVLISWVKWQSWVIVLLFMMLGHSTLFGQSVKNRFFQAGASTSNITPPLGEPIVGNWDSPPADYIHDELFARCLVLDDGETRLGFVLVDNVGVKQEVLDAAKEMIHESTGIPTTHIMIASTHTHSAISAGGTGAKRRGWTEGESLDAYQSFIASRIADGVRIALKNLEPARIGWGSGSVPQHVFNRRWKMKQGTPMPNPLGGDDLAVMNPGVANPNLLEPAGPTDPEVSYLSVQAVDGRPLALLANYSLHYVGGVPKGHISADYFGVFADRIQEILQADGQHPPFVAMMSNGTSGDVNNINFRGPSVSHPPYGKMKLVAGDVVREVLRDYHDIGYQNWVELKAKQENISLKVRKPTPELSKFVKEVMARPESASGRHGLEKTYAERVIQMETWPDEISVIIQAFKIGELGIGAIPFETFAETGLEIKDKSPMDKTFTISFANGSFGYLPTPRQHKLGGYETWLSTSRVEESASEKIVGQLLKLLSSMD